MLRQNRRGRLGVVPRQRSTGMDRVFYPSSNAAGPRTFQEQK